MWWLFEKRSESGQYVEYAYSRESRNLDGRVRVFRTGERAEMLQACGVDVEDEASQAWAVTKALRLAREGFPDRRMVAVG